MAAPKKEKLTLGIGEYPYLEEGFLFALACRRTVTIPIIVNGRSYPREVLVDSIRVPRKNSDILIIRGRFPVDGKRSWINVGLRAEGFQLQPEREYYLWGNCIVFYDRKTRTGSLETRNYAFHEEIFAGLRAREAKAS